MSRCRFDEAPDEIYTVTPDGALMRGGDVRLCTWALYAPAAQDKMLDTPRWLQRNALAGHLMHAGDCARCPCFAPSLSLPHKGGGNPDTGTPQ